MKIVKIVFLAILLCATQHSWSAEIYEFKQSKGENYLGQYLKILEDPKGTLTIDDVLNSKKFEDAESRVPFLGISKSNWWIRFTIKNSSKEKELFLTLDQPTLDYVDFYTLHQDGTYELTEMGEVFKFQKREIYHQQYIFSLNILPGESNEYILRLKSGEQILVPLQVFDRETMTQGLLSKD
ncbi:MAG: hypothetical protein HRT57_09515, partial [Crocinitomicaceae bacterium]|nr:hypothetical protein [Crocinitomicaceae bacterium]